MNREKEEKNYERLFKSAEKRMLECKRQGDAAGWRDLAGQMAQEGLRRKILTPERVEAVQKRFDLLMKKNFSKLEK